MVKNEGVLGVGRRRYVNVGAAIMIDVHNVVDDVAAVFLFAIALLLRGLLRLTAGVVVVVVSVVGVHVDHLARLGRRRACIQHRRVDCGLYATAWHRSLAPVLVNDEALDCLWVHGEALVFGTGLVDLGDLVWVRDLAQVLVEFGSGSVSHSCVGLSADHLLSLVHRIGRAIVVDHVSVAGEAVRVPGRKHLQLLVADVDPRVAQNIFSARSALRFLCKDALQELLGLRRDVIRHLQLFRADVRVELFVVLSFEREATTEQGKQKHS